MATLTNKELFDFVVNPAITDETLDTALDDLMEKAATRPIVPTVEEELAEKVWAQAYIPKKLEEVVHFERDHERLQKGENVEGIYYQAIAGMKEDMSGAIARGLPSREGGTETPNPSENSEESGADSSDVETSDDEYMFEEREKLTKEEVRELRKANKKQVKAEKAERRKTKVKKHVKKRATKKKKP